MGRPLPVLNFVNYTWVEDAARFDSLEEALAFIPEYYDLKRIPWRIQEWIDIRNGPAEAGFWHDVEWWIDGKQHRATTERIT